MMDERLEELASLYAFDLLEGDERAHFEAAMARDRQLQALVRQLRDTGASLARTAHAVPPPALKQRVLKSIDTVTRPAPPRDNVIRATPSFRMWNVVPWLAAACLAIAAGLLWQRYLSAQQELAATTNRQALGEIALKTAHQQLEAEQIIRNRQLQDTQQQLASANTQLAEARNQLAERERLLAEARSQVNDRERTLADLRAHVAQREQLIATLTKRVDSLVAASSNMDRQLADSKLRIAALLEEMKAQSDLADFKITALASMLKNSPQALAVAVWDPKKQEGLVAFEKLPPLAPDQKLEFWVVEAKQNAKPISAGVLNLGGDNNARIRFKPTAPVSVVAAFAVSREKNDGAPAHSAPTEVVMLGNTR